MRKLGLTLLTASFFLLASSLGATASASQPVYALQAEGEKAAFAVTGDLLIARPIMLLRTIGGAALFTVTLPVTAITGNASEVGDALVAKPARHTFKRCLGCTEVR